jgi:Leucine-rich repeat (LRR) protein
MQALLKIALSGWVVLLAFAATAVQGQEKKVAGNGIDAATVAAYEKLGAIYGGWAKGDVDRLFQAGQKHAEEGVPGFLFRTFPKSKFPTVDVPFGLDFFQSDATDAGLKELAHLKNLAKLSLMFTKVTDAGLKELAPLKNLAELDLFDTKVTDAGLKELAPLKNLVSLNLFNTQVTDAGLRELALLKNIAYLDLGGTKITNAGLERFASA